MNADIKALLANWQAAAARMREAEKAELDARMALVAVAFPSPHEGTNNAEVGDGTVLKGKFKYYYNLDNARVEGVAEKLPPAIARTLFKWKADLSLSAYKGLEPAHRAIVNEVLTVSPGRPSIEVVTPKEL